MSIRSLPLLLLLCVSLSHCYEERTGCLDPDSSNYDLRADVACPDCCTYPQLSVRVSTVWQDSAIVAGQTYTDGAGHPFRIVRFRYYLGDLRLLSPTGELPVPQRPVELSALDGTDTIPLTVNGNYLLASTAVSTTIVGSLQAGNSSISGLTGTYGLPDRYRDIVPATAPTGDALRTQPGRLNFRDGEGYVQSRLEYVLLSAGDTVTRSVSSYGSVPFELDFGTEVTPERGLNLRVNLQARLADLLGTIDLTADSSAVAAALNREVEFLFPVSLTQE